jgi:hypothetical protein
MARSSFQIALLDGRSYSFTSTTYLCTADRVAFERHFGINSGTLLENLRGLFTADGAPVEGANLSAVREEHLAFFIWRAATRAVSELAGVSFEDFLDQLAEIEEAKEEEADPTAPVRLLG